MHPLELKIPPPVVALVIALGMWANAASGPVLAWPMEWRIGASLALAAAGICIDVAALWSFWRARTTPNPLRPDRSSFLVTTGIYARSRNPMYVGLLLYLIAWAVYLSALWPLPGPVLFVLYLNRFQIGPEERILQQRFGNAFSAYAARVRRWV